MGTPEFALPSLRALHSRHEVVAAYTQPDRPSGRGRAQRPSPVKELAGEFGVPVRQPRTLRDADEIAHLRALAPDVVCVAAYGMILPPELLAIPPHGCINVHASLLPRYRGAAPVHRAILSGERVTGVSIMKMEEGLDTGPYALQVEVPVGESTVEELTDTLSVIGAHALLDVLEQVENGTVAWTPQDDSVATYASKITRDDVSLDPAMSVAEAMRRVRASTRSASTRICLDGRTLTVLSVAPADIAVESGAVSVEAGQPVIGFADGALVLTEVRPEGRSLMEGSCFARGARLDAGCAWERCE